MPTLPTNCRHGTERDHHAVAPEVADRLAAVWSDIASASRRLEALLGGGAPPLPDTVIIELVRVYECLEDCLAEGRLPSSLDPTSTNHC